MKRVKSDGCDDIASQSVDQEDRGIRFVAIDLFVLFVLLLLLFV